MSQTPKRTVGRRKAAEKSEKKWKEALEEEQTYEALPDVFLGARVPVAVSQKNNGPCNNPLPVIPDPVPAVEKEATKPEPVEPSVVNEPCVVNEPSVVNEPCVLNESSVVNVTKGRPNFTTLEDETLKDIIESLACVSCFTQSLSVSLLKNSQDETEEVVITCTKCNEKLFRNLNSNKESSSINSSDPSYDNATLGDICGNEENIKKADGENSNNVEHLVCDVDVMKEDQSKVPVSETDLAYSNCQKLANQKKRKRKRIISRVKKKQHIKPIRPCFFCSKMQARLSRHVKTTHTNHPYVQNMLKQPREVQAKMMRQLRSEGIFAENQRRIKAGRFDLLRIRNQGTGELSACIYCRGYYKKKLLWRHRSTCIARPTAAQEGPCDLQRLSGDDLEESEEAKGNPIGEDNNNWDNAASQDKEVRKHCNGDGDQLSSDPPEISRIREILDGLEHGIFSQTEAEPVKEFFIKQEREDYIEDDSPLIEENSISTRHLEMTMREGDPIPQNKEMDPVNEDQLLFDSLPAILSNSNAPSFNSPPLQSPFEVIKNNKEQPHPDGFSDENYYYMWQDIPPSEFQQQELIPCNTLFPTNRKRKPRSEFQYQFWKKEEEEMILAYFTDAIQTMKVPGKDACKEFLSKNPNIQTDWTRVKYKVYNQIQKKKKKMKKA